MLVDGGQHFLEENKIQDDIRDNFLKSQGLKVLRFNNLEVLKNIQVVREVIACELRCD